MDSQVKSALSQILVVVVKNIVLINHGMNLSFSAILIGESLKKNSEDFSNMSIAQLSWIGSIAFTTVFIGSLLSAIVTQPLGRKRSMQLTSIPFVLCWIALYLSSEIWHILLALSVMGLFGGLLEAPIMAFIVEITEPYLRGVLASTSPLFFMMGVTMEFILGNFFQWRTCALISCATPILSFVLFCFIPESPYWLLSKNKIDKAKQSLAWLRGWKSVSDIESEIQEMIRDSLNGNLSTRTWNFNLKPFFKKSFIFPLGILATAMAMSSFTGAASLQTYAIITFQSLKVPINSHNATVCLGISQVCGILVNIGSVYFLGRRKSLFASVIGILACNIILATYMYITDIKYLITSSDEVVHDFGSLGYIPLVALLALSFTHHIGLFTLPIAMMGEVFPYETRSVGCGLAGAIGCSFLFISKKVHLDLIFTITLFYTFVLQSILAFGGLLFMYFVLPETEGKSLNEIKNHFLGISKLERKVKRRQNNECV